MKRQFDGFVLLFGQVLNCRKDQHARLHGGDRVEGTSIDKLLDDFRCTLRVVLQAAAPLGRTQAVNGLVAGQGHGSRHPFAAGGIVEGGLFPDLNEHFLERVLGGVPSGQDAIRRGEQHAGTAIVLCPETLGISASSC